MYFYCYFTCFIVFEPMPIYTHMAARYALPFLVLCLHRRNCKQLEVSVLPNSSSRQITLHIDTNLDSVQPPD